MAEDIADEKPQSTPFRNTEHCTKAFQTMNSLRLQNILCDVVIKTGLVEFPAHKVVLASCSAYFYAMFTGELSESKQMNITMKDVDPAALEMLLEFAYTAEIQVTEENVQVVISRTNIANINSAVKSMQNILGSFTIQGFFQSFPLGLDFFSEKSEFT